MRIFREKDSEELSTTGAVLLIVAFMAFVMFSVYLGLRFGGEVVEPRIFHESVVSTLSTKQEVTMPIPPCDIVENNYNKSVAVLNDLNSYRSSMGLPLYQLDERLTYFASHKAHVYSQTRDWNHDMGGRTWGDIYADCGKIDGWYGENLAKGFDTTEGLLQAWLNSPRHHEVLDNPVYKKVGIFAGGEDLDFYIVTLFAE